MERLTKVDGVGQNDLIRCFDCTPEKAGEHLENCGYCEDGWRKALDKLAAYEDTGLEPEDLVKNAEITQAMRFVMENADLERLVELVKAEKDGRLVVLPVPVGSSVYTLCCNTVVEKCIGEFRVNSHTRPRRLADLVSQSKRWDMVVGQTVFLTREEAEAALGAEKEH